MGLNIKPTSALEKKLAARIETWINKKIDVLAGAGEILIKEAKESGNYQDDTGDLRASIGFLVMYAGEVKKEHFTAGPAGTEARSKAIAAAQGLKGISLIVIAGKNYAAYVESQGYNVLTSAQQLAATLIPKLLKHENSI